MKISSLQGGGSVSTKFSHGRGRAPPITFAWIDRPMNALQLVVDSFHAKKLCSRLSSSEVQFYMENGHFAFLSSKKGYLGERMMFILGLLEST